MVVLHYTAMASAAAALDRLCDPAAEVSSHYLIGRDGRLWHLVDEDRRAWHAGAGSWGGLEDVNSRSVGIELDNSGTCPFSAPLMDRLEPLLGDIMARHGIPPQGVIAHSDMAPARKTDPGPRFDWARLARNGLSVWPDLAPVGPVQTGPEPDPEAFAQAASRFGYGPRLDHARRLAAFRLRFRPWADGPLNQGDMAAITTLADRFAVDGAGPAA